MKYTEVKPNVSQHIIVFDSKEDKEMHWKCNWARITLDHDHYSMSAVTDCGDYTYTWCATPEHESFLELMCRIDRWYLLDKIANRSEFNLEASKKNTIKNLEYIDPDRVRPFSNIKQMEVEINEIDVADASFFFMEAERITDGLLDCESIETIMDYPRRAEVFCEVFCDYLQPELRKSRDKLKT